MLKGFLATAVACGVVSICFSCLEDICAPRVSKCLLIESCNCSMSPGDMANRNCTCCRDCHRCLGDLFMDCCSCVGLCKPPAGIDRSLVMRSNIEDLDVDESGEYLFEVLTAEDENPDERWTTLTFPAIETANFVYKHRKERHELLQNQPEEARMEDVLRDVNCTVAFMSSCSSLDKCRRFCASMGASSYRWFHNGCCECNGKTCLNYGLRKAMCTDCPEFPDPVDSNSVRQDEL